MLLKEFPDIDWLKQAIAKDFSEGRSWDNRLLPDKGWPTAILNVKTNTAERKDIKGPFSLFINKSGSSQVCCDKKTVSITPDTYILSNNGQHYDLLIDQKKPVETFNIHFGQKLLEDTVHTLAKSDENLLDNIHSSSVGFNLPIKSVFRDDHFNELIRQVEYTYQQEEKENTLHALLSYLLISNSNHLRQINEIIHLKASTKEELIKRVYLAVDFIHSNYSATLSLDQLAEHAMLSKFHFLRVFKSFFGKSPHQYIKQIRLQKAIELVKQTDLPLYLIAQQVGIENGSSLSRMMFQLTGQRPSALATN